MEKETMISVDSEASMIDKVGGIDLLKRSVDRTLYPAFLCQSNPKNPFFFEIIHSNRRFHDAFGIKPDLLIGNNYDFLFQDIDDDYASTDRVEYDKLIKAVKNFSSVVVNIKIVNFKDRSQSDVFKVSFTPNSFKVDGNLYCVFTFEKSLSGNVDIVEATDDSDSRVIINLERSLRVERIMRAINDLIVSDSTIRQIAAKISKSIFEYLNIDRCLLYGYNSGKITFVAEYYNRAQKSIIRNDDNNDLTSIAEYIEFQNYIFGNSNNVDKRNTTILCENIAEDSRFRKIGDVCDKFAIRSQIVVVTAINNQINGGVCIHQSSDRKWSVEEVGLVEMVANNFAVAIDRSRSFDEIMIANNKLLQKTLALRKALEEEKRMRQMQNEFVAMVSHEFKTPLQIIDGTREVITRKLKSLLVDDDSLYSFLAKIKNAVLRMNGLIQSTLSLSKMEMNKDLIKIDKQNFDIKALINDIIDRSLTLANAKSIKIEADITSLPDSFKGDSKSLDHCFVNLVSNAIKYSKNNSVVKVSGFKKDNDILVKVSDGGIGIPKADLENIGKKFFRASNTLASPGTGIGLYLTKYFVELHNGSVLIESEVNVGTTITISLPIS